MLNGLKLYEIWMSQKLIWLISSQVVVVVMIQKLIKKLQILKIGNKNQEYWYIVVFNLKLQLFFSFVKVSVFPGL